MKNRRIILICLLGFLVTLLNCFGQSNRVDYSRGFIYKNNSLDFFKFPEGRVTVNDGQKHQLEYKLNDHLGNMRVIFSQDSEEELTVLQQNHYYPFGMNLGGTKKISDLSSENKFTYNGKEFEDENGLVWYHYGARYYDPQIAKWTAQDPADEFHSSYTYVHNDPVNFLDPDGMAEDEGANVGGSTRSVAVGSNGIQMLGSGEEAIHRGTYTAPMAQWHADRGRTNYAEVLEAGHGCSACHLTHALGRAPKNSELNMGTYNNYSYGTKVIGTLAEELVAFSSGRVLADKVIWEAEKIVVFRGIDESHTYYDDALKGIAKPRGGNATPKEHQLGNSNSKYTSWTTDPAVAVHYASRGGSTDGVVLVRKVHPSKAIKLADGPYELILNQNKSLSAKESEVLLEGIIRGSRVAPAHPH